MPAKGDKMNPLIVPFFFIGVQQLAAMSAQQEDREHKFGLAQAYADYVGKPLLVVGGPYGSKGFRRAFDLPAHGFGDYCLDMNPEACDGGSEYVEADVRDIPFPDKFFGAAIASHVLEHLRYVQDCIDAVNELNRVAEVVMVAYPTPDLIIASLIPDHWLWLHQDGNTLYVQQRK